MGTLFLQLFLFVNVALIGALVVIAFQHAQAHYRPKHRKAEKAHHDPEDIQLPPEIKAQLLQVSRTNFQGVLDHSATSLQKDLQHTALQLNKLLESLGTELVGNELERYRMDLAAMHTQVETAFKNAQTEIAQHQSEITEDQQKLLDEYKTKLSQEVEAEKQRLIAQIDTKLADAVASFLVETLQHNVDLGAQSTYLTAVLEEHKGEFLKEVSDETQTAK